MHLRFRRFLRRFRKRIIQVHHNPSLSVAPAHGKAVSTHQALFRRFNGVILGVPEGITVHLHLMGRHPVAEVWSVAEKVLT